MESSVHSKYTQLKVTINKSMVLLSLIFALDTKSFYIHWYCRPGKLVWEYTEIYGHFDILNGKNIKETCASCCFNEETGGSLICCLIRDKTLYVSK